jgi:glycopeptide antibiotics resistance protein
MAFLQKDTGTFDFLVTYSKVLTILCIVDLCVLPFKLFYLPAIEPNHQYQSIGGLLNTVFMSGILPIVVLVFIRKAKKAAKGYSPDGKKDR